MAWIESHQELREHPKTKRLCRLLGVNRREAVGLLHFLWWWAYDYAAEGDLSSFTDEDIADAVDWEGDAALLTGALIEAGFLDDSRHIHDWEEFAEKWIERRRANADRMRAARAARMHRTPEERADHVQRTSGARAGATGPDLTKPNRTGPDIDPPVVPPDEPRGEDGAGAPPAKAAPSQSDLMRRLSKDAREVLDFHREQHGRARPAKLTPAAVEALEEAVTDLGVDRCKEGVRYLARKIPPVPDLSKALAAARTKRQSEAPGATPPTQPNGRPPPSGWGRPPRTNGMTSIAQNAEEEAALEAWANGR